ncbi:MAG TPA: hypothetical protein VM889_06470, partial [Candidatus Thermoplasmatota archaeon]|nr:hypothetical protein [Candidatus Thermoplasmatota archaeon]
MHRARTLLALALILLSAAAFAGCVSCTQGPPVTARGIGPGAAHEAGTGPATLVLRITDEPGGPAIPGAGVVAYHANDATGAWRGNVTARAEADRDGARVVVGPGFDAHPSPEARTAYRLRADPNGEVTLRLPAGHIIGLVAAADGHTEEWIPALATGEAGTHETLEFPLFRANLTKRLEGALAPAGASPGAVTRSHYAWHPHKLAFAGDDTASRHYLARIVELKATLTWTNGLEGAGDLAIGLGPRREQPAYVHDGATDAAAGARTETTLLDADRLRREGILAAPEAHVGPATGTAFVGPFGLKY